MPQIKPVVAKAETCTDAELAEFCKLVREGGAVDNAGLEGRVKRAKALVFLKVDESLVGVGALKMPDKSYRDEVFQKAGVPNAAAVFDLELGWVFVRPTHRRKGFSLVVSAAAMSQSERKPTFATTRLDNLTMQKTLEHLAFRRFGDSWRSERGEKARLVLYVTG
jgi:hypothetical protein